MRRSDLFEIKPVAKNVKKLNLKKWCLLLLAGACVIGVCACGHKKKADDGVEFQPADTDGLESYLADFEESYGKIKDIEDYLDDLQIAVMSKRDYGIDTAEKYNNTLVFTFADGSEDYAYTPEGFEPYDPDDDLESDVEAPGYVADVPNVGQTVSYADVPDIDVNADHPEE